MQFDPDAALALIRRAAADGDGTLMAETFDDLDTWLRCGGRRPRDWVPATTAVVSGDTRDWGHAIPAGTQVWLEARVPSGPYPQAGSGWSVQPVAGGDGADVADADLTLPVPAGP